MDRIPINFTHNGKPYSAYFSQVQGAGSNAVFHLMDDQNYFSGRLRHSDRWVFDPTPKTEFFSNMGDEFGEYMTAWFE